MPRPHSEIIYLAADRFDSPSPPFRTGKAGFVRIGTDEQIELELRIRLSANTTHALIGHGVVDRLNELGFDGRIGSGIPVMIRPSQLEAARTILYAADRNTYGGRWDFLVARVETPRSIEYRLAVQNREYQVGLTRLIDVLNEASRMGLAVWVEI